MIFDTGKARGRSASRLLSGIIAGLVQNTVGFYRDSSNHKEISSIVHSACDIPDILELMEPCHDNCRPVPREAFQPLHNRQHVPRGNQTTFGYLCIGRKDG